MVNTVNQLKPPAWKVIITRMPPHGSLPSPFTPESRTRSSPHCLARPIPGFKRLNPCALFPPGASHHRLGICLLPRTSFPLLLERPPAGRIISFAPRPLPGTEVALRIYEPEAGILSPTLRLYTYYPHSIVVQVLVHPFDVLAHTLRDARR